MTHRATALIRSFNSGSLPSILRADDGNHYLVKFQGNPQGSSVLARELVCSRVAHALGIPIPDFAPIVVSEEFIFANHRSFRDQPSHFIPCPGIHFGSKLVAHDLVGQTYDVMPVAMACKLRNPQALPAMTAFSFYVGNIDRIQYVFCKLPREKRYRATLIDFGFAFGGPSGSIPSTVRNSMLPPSHLIFPQYWHEMNLGWLFSKIEHLDPIWLTSLTEDIPSEWLDDPIVERFRILQALLIRRALVRSQMSEACASLRPRLRSKRIGYYGSKWMTAPPMN